MGFDQLADIRKVSLPRLMANCISLERGIRGTDEMQKLATPDDVIFAISSSLIIFVLALTGWMYRSRKARAHLRRVSFRLMLWALCFQLGYNAFRFAMLVSTGTWVVAVIRS